MRLIIFLSLLFPVSGFGQKFAYVEKPSEKKIDFFYGKQLITSYIYYDSLFKTALYPISTLNGTHITREYPYVKKAGERTDHPHHVGLFFAHQSVNGHDFWNMSTAIKPKDRSRYGTQRLDNKNGYFQYELILYGKKAIGIDAICIWKLNDGDDVLTENTRMKFSASRQDLIIDRVTTLTALTDVTFKDEKDALMGLRVARELELPVKGTDRFVLPDGSESEPMENDITQVTGDYKNSESIIGADVWGKKANWVCLDGKINGKDISVAIIDHPKNIDYPSYWHARGYGLFAVNPLGKDVFTEGKAKINLTLKKGEATTFRYRIVIREGSKLTPAELNQYLKNFSEPEVKKP
jgi:hypothetical protein